MRQLFAPGWFLVFSFIVISSAAPAEAPKRRRLLERATAKTSERLIDEALAAGQIDYDTSITYKVFAAFSDCRLPAQFRGKDEQVFESSVFGEIRRNGARLSTATHATLAPFFLPPSAPGGWLELGTSCEEPSGKLRPTAIEWTTVTTRNNKVKVWAQKRFQLDVERATTLANEIDQTIWPKLVQVMGREPLGDGNRIVNGGDEKLDVYLVHISDSGLFHGDDCQETAGHILVDTFLPNVGYLSFAAVRSSLAHELMHAIQLAFKADLCNEYAWLGEAGATWAEQYVYPEDNAERSFAPDFLHHPDTSLEDTGENHEYGAYLLPFYLQHGSNDTTFLRRVWETAGPDSLVTIDAVLQRYGGLARVWPDFAWHNLNQKPFDFYQSWDSQPTPFTTRADVRKVDHNYDAFSTRETVFPEIESIKHLSAQYIQTIPNDFDRTFVFYNGITFKLGKNLAPVPMEQAGSTLAFTVEPIAPEKRKGAKVEALVRIGNAWRPVEDWTDRPFVSFCRDFESERIEELVVIITNSEFKDTSHELRPEGSQPAIVFASPIACAEWRGWARVREELEPGVTLKVDAPEITWKRAIVPTGSGVSGVESPYGQGVAAMGTAFTPQGTVTWSVAGSANDCTFSGNGSYDASTAQGVLTLFTHLPAASKLYRSFFGVHSLIPFPMYTMACKDKPVEMLPVPPWFFTDPEDFQKLKANLVEGKLTAGDVTWEWSFKPQP